VKDSLFVYYGWFRSAMSGLQPVFLLFVRIWWGWQFFQTGLGKVHHLGNVTDFFMQLGLPAPHVTAIFIAWLELIGGILLIIGLLSRITAAAFFIDMIVAFIVADAAAFHSFFSDPSQFWAATPATFLLASFLILIFGPGLFALDTLIASVRRGS
jgi:putative oxidoreductase